MFGHKERKYAFKREPLTDLEDLRDDCIALFLNSGMTQQQVHAAGGPTPGTISKWLYKETRFPRMDSIRSMLRALGCDMVIMPKEAAENYRRGPASGRLGITANIHVMPGKKRRA